MNVIIMLGHFKKSASILTNQETQMVGNDRWPATICNTGSYFSRNYQQAFFFTEAAVDRSSCWQMFFKIGVLKNFAIFSGKNCDWVSCRRSSLQLYWKATPAQVFSCEYCKIFKNNFLIKSLSLVAASTRKPLRLAILTIISVSYFLE